MRLSTILSPLGSLNFGIKVALPPTIRALVEEPRLILNPRALSRVFFSFLWGEFADDVDQSGKEVKEDLIRPHAYGVVLDIGAGFGHTANYLDTTLVTKYVALEPNVLMHHKIREVASRAGFSERAGTLIILTLGAESVDAILKALSAADVPNGQVDTLVSVLTLCSVPDAQKAITSLVTRVVKPHGGQVLFYEHCKSTKKDVAWWQSMWSPLWSIVFDGCVLDRPTPDWLVSVGGWEEVNIWTAPENSPDDLFWHRLGRLVRA